MSPVLSPDLVFQSRLGLFAPCRRRHLLRARRQWTFLSDGVLRLGSSPDRTVRRSCQRPLKGRRAAGDHVQGDLRLPLMRRRLVTVTAAIAALAGVVAFEAARFGDDVLKGVGLLGKGSAGVGVRAPKPPPSFGSSRFPRVGRHGAPGLPVGRGGVPRMPRPLRRRVGETYDGSGRPVGGAGSEQLRSREQLRKLAAEGDSQRQVVCLGFDLLQRGDLPPTVDGFAQTIATELAQEVYTRTSRGKSEQIYGLLKRVGRGDVGAARDAACL